jgi:hypothetical protein
MASKRRPPCRCCRHELPHCKCRLDQKPRPKPRPVRTKPEPCPLSEYLSLFEIAYAVYVASKKAVAVTTGKVAGAIRSLGLRDDKGPYKTVVNAAVVFRQQTMVHKSKLPLLQKYLIEGNQS